MELFTSFVIVMDLGALRANVRGCVCAQRKGGKQKSLCTPESPYFSIAAAAACRRDIFDEIRSHRDTKDVIN